MLTLLIKKQGGRKPPCRVVGMTGQLSNLLSQAAPDEAHQDKKPTLAKAMGGRSRDDWIRTSDPLHPMQVRYRAALRPVLPVRGANLKKKRYRLKDSPSLFSASLNLAIQTGPRARRAGAAINVRKSSLYFFERSFI